MPARRTTKMMTTKVVAISQKETVDTSSLRQGDPVYSIRFEFASRSAGAQASCLHGLYQRANKFLRSIPTGHAGETPALVRLKAYSNREVKVLFRHTLSGLKPNETASPRGGVGSNRR